MNHWQKLLTYLFLLITSLYLGADLNAESVKRFSVSDGLPSNAINCIYEDSRGLFWLCTDAGLFEFTGEDVKFRNELSKLQGEEIKSISEDNNGDLWILANGLGVCQFTGENLLIHQLDLLIPDNEINCIYKDVESRAVFVGTSNGLYRYDPNSEIAECIPGTREKSITNIHFDGRKLQINCFNQAQNFEFELRNKQVKPRVVPNHKRIVLGENTIENKNLLVPGEFFKLIDEYGTEFHCDVIDFAKNKSAEFFLLRYFEKEIEKRKLLKVCDNKIVDLSVERNLNEFVLTSLLVRDSDHTLFVGTGYNGILELDELQFKYIPHNKFNFVLSAIVDLATNDNGDIVLASTNEIALINNSKFKRKILVEDFCVASKGKVNCKKNLTIYDIDFDGNKLVWIASNRGFFKLNLKNQQLKFVGITAARNFVITNDGKILCFWNNEFQFYTKEGRKLKRSGYKFPSQHKVEISKMISYKSSIWISSKQKGILRYQDNKFKIFNRKNSKVHNVVNDMLVLSDSIVVVGGNDGLVYKLKNTQNSIEIIDSLSSERGLNGTTIHGIQYLKDGSLWCGTNTGVHRFEYETWQKNQEVEFVFWNSKNGYSDQTGDRSIVDHEENIWIKTRSNKVLKIATQEINWDKGGRSELCLNRVQIHNKNWKPDSVEVDKWSYLPLEPINFKHSENDLTFHFGFKFCSNTSNTQYRYFLEGFENDWGSWSSGQVATFSNLPGGEYTLKVEGRNLSENNIIPFSFQINIAVPWWKTLWFYAALLLLIAVLSFIASRIYVRILRKREKSRTKQFNRVIGLKMKSLQNQMDPHFIFNSLNSIQSYILDGNVDSALEYLSDFSNVLRKNINNANKSFIPLSDEINYLKHYLKLEQMRFFDKFSYQIKIDAAINPLQYNLPPMLIQPFLENAIKYGLSGGDTKGELLLSFKLENDNYLKCLIIDNGIGRTKAKKKHSDSNISDHHKTLAISRDRIKLLNKVLGNGQTYSYSVVDLFDDNNSACGTKVEIGFPKREIFL